VVRRHNNSGLYVTLSNPQTTAAAGRDQRSVLALTVSEDLRTWRRHDPSLLRHPLKTLQNPP
jgi:hypothetical protein